MTPIRVLVTGAGSGVGQGIVKALRIAALPVTIIAGDIDPLQAGLYRADEAVLIPRVEEDGALERLVEIIFRLKVQVLMVGSEFDLSFIAQHKNDIESATGAVVIVSPTETVAIADDKWLTYEFLGQHGFSRPRSALAADVDAAAIEAAALGYPVILKSRNGTSGRNVHVIPDEHTLRRVFATVPKPMLQELIGTPGNDLNHEYTCSVFCCSDDRLLGPITGRRTLRGGNSWVIEIDTFAELNPFLLAIAQQLPSMGSLNIQLRLGSGGPMPFEFNARFSGTTAVRAHFGFNEPEMALRSYFLGETLDQPAIGRGLAFRYLEEVFVDNQSAAQTPGRFPRGRVRQWF